MNNFRYLQPKSLQDAGNLMLENKNNALLFAGGTDALGLIKNKIVVPDNVVNLKLIKDLEGIKYTQGKEIRIGAHGGDCWPRKYGLNGCIPALTSSSVGSSAIRLAEGTTVWPRCSKYVRKRRAISADSISGHPPHSRSICSRSICSRSIGA